MTALVQKRVSKLKEADEYVFPCIVAFSISDNSVWCHKAAVAPVVCKMAPPLENKVVAEDPKRTETDAHSDAMGTEEVDQWHSTREIDGWVLARILATVDVVESSGQRLLNLGCEAQKLAAVGRRVFHSVCFG